MKRLFGLLVIVVLVLAGCRPAPATIAPTLPLISHGDLVTIAPSNSSPAMKENATIVLTGADDQELVNYAISAAGSGGHLVFYSGRVICSDSILANKTSQMMTGQAYGTVFESSPHMTTDLIVLSADSFTLKDIWLQGKRTSGQVAGSGIRTPPKSMLMTFTMDGVAADNFPEYGAYINAAQLYWGTNSFSANGLSGVYISSNVNNVTNGHLGYLWLQSNLGHGGEFISLQDFQADSIFSVMNHKDGVHVVNCANSRFGIISDDNDWNGVVLGYGNDHCVMVIQSWNNSQAANHAYYGVYIAAGNTNNTLTISSFSSDGLPKKHKADVYREPEGG